MATEYKERAAYDRSEMMHIGARSFSYLSDSSNDNSEKITSPRNGQNLAGSGALVFEGELLEIPVWN